MEGIRSACFLKAINLSIYFITSRMVLFPCLVTFVLSRHTLNAEAVFVTMALFNTLGITMTLYFPQAISLGAELMISCKRILVNKISVHTKVQRIEIWLKFQNFLELEEIEKKSVEYRSSEKQKSSVEVIVNDITAKWNDVSLDFTSLCLVINHRIVRTIHYLL